MIIRDADTKNVHRIDLNLLANSSDYDCLEGVCGLHIHSSR